MRARKKTVTYHHNIIIIFRLKITLTALLDNVSFQRHLLNLVGRNDIPVEQSLNEAFSMD
mgnify:CR=1 FL=1